MLLFVSFGALVFGELFIRLSTMEQKRPWGQEVAEEEDGDLPVGESKRQRKLIDSMREVVAVRHIQQHLPKMELFLRKVVHEEVQDALQRYVYSTSRLQTTVSKDYHLQFQNSLPKTIFTSNNIVTEDQSTVRIVLMDSDFKIITSGHLSSAKIEILVLDGDFCADGREDWTEKEFSDSIVHARQGKRPLLTGDLVITLSKGVGCLGDINFTDNSSWIRSRKFRLGARVSSSGCTGNVQEAMSEAFVVKDHRGESYKKHHPPHLTDDVWRLEKIGKDGVFHKKLEEGGINTVQDFLKRLVLDEHRLRQLLGNGMSNKMWEAVVQHARDCIIPEDKLYFFAGSSGIILLLNCIYKPVGALFSGNYYGINEVPPTQMALVTKLKQEAYTSPELIVECNQQLVEICHGVLPQSTQKLGIPVASWLEQQLTDLPATSQGVPAQEASPLPLHHPTRSHFMEDPNQAKDIPTEQTHKQDEWFDSFPNNLIHPRDGYNLGLSNFETSGSMGRFQPENNMLLSSPYPEMWDHDNDLVHLVGAVTTRYYPYAPDLRDRSSSRRWAKLMAVSKLIAVARRCTKRLRVVDTHHPSSILPGIYATDTYGDVLWSC